MEPEQPKLKYATTKNQLIQAIVGEHFRFASIAQAKSRLKSLEEEFIRSKNRPENAPEEAVYLWIKDFAISDKDKESGYKGNFALINYREIKAKGGVSKYTLFAKKIPVDVKSHPQQQRPKTSHPNWGHPILRYIKKGKTYKTVTEAEKDLQALHEEYPTTTIPLGNKLNLMIYSKLYEGNNVRKFLLEIKTHKDGGFFIEIIEKEEKKKATQAAIATKSETEQKNEPQGYFSSMVLLRKNKKKKK